MWTAEKTARLIELWNAGAMSASLIGRELGFTRNAIIGKAHRLKLHLRVPAVRSDGATSTPLLRPRPKPVIFQPRPRPRPPVVGGVSFADIDFATQCRWLIDDGRYCGAGVSTGVYCDEHRRVAYVASRPSVRRSFIWRIK